MPSPGYPRGYAYPDYIERDAAIAERDEARAFAQTKYDECELLQKELDATSEAYHTMYSNWAKAERERDEEIKRRDMWIEIARKNFRHAGRMMRERDAVVAMVQVVIGRALDKVE